MLGRITLALLLLAAPAWAENWRATYVISAAGVHVMDAEIRFTLGPAGTPYSLETRTRSRGVASLFMRSESQARSEGILRAGAASPRRYQSDGTWRGMARRTLLEYGPDGTARVTTLEPAQDLERTPLPDDARRGNIDPLSALVLLTGHVRETARCDIRTRTFDGRRLVQFDVTTDPIVQVADRGMLRCIVESRPLAGIAMDRPIEDAARPTRSVLLFGVTRPGAPAIPVRIDIASRWWGNIQANLVELTSAD
ncbi:DUF3108 domain-containing protein [Sediminicoccus sp. KRV36]|uniref:DUF3108 domain-containing protein n=1 Tax=Sediminicoccus sp. KRV36 TaxID=3133721 RepID=UPI0020102522|nr:DUF3108 domain-containing protein [Sediminicoccus rosea]UPY37377.1 DUF3108 domain-containing protein [Sediminicoccus rosea]